METLKFWLLYISVFSFGIGSFVFMISAAPSPESVIVGEWKELAWEYEKVNKTNDSVIVKSITDEMRKELAQDLIIHEAETWVFMNNRKLKLVSSDGLEKIVNWRIKGRGNILQIKHDELTVENYNLTQLDDDSMVLNIELDVQARGIAKLTFEKNR